MISIFFYVTFFLFSLGQLGRVSLNNGQINFYLYEVALLIQALFFFYKLRLDPIKKTFNNFKVAYIFIFVLLFSYSIGLFKFAPIQNFVALLYIARLLLYLAYLLYLYFFIKKNSGYKPVLKKGL